MLNWKNYNRYNNIIGWLVFIIAAVVYLMTVGPTASLWDCAEFIACDYKLEIGHPPGAPFYMLIYNIATHLAPSVSQVALYANAMSGILSAFTILFLFWTISHMVRRVVSPNFNKKNKYTEKISTGNAVIIYGSALVGALAYTFSDTFWFSAIEAEVYSFSSFFTAIVFWLIFVWEERSGEPDSDRWIILIAYLMGLSIGVHLLNLLCIPAMALVVYYKKSKKQSIKGWLITLLVSFILIAIMMFGIIQGIPKIAGYFDFIAVNSLGFGVNSGLYVYLILLLLVLVASMFIFTKEKDREINGKRILPLTRLIVAITFILMGIPFMSGFFVALIWIVAIVVFTFFIKKVNRQALHLVQMCMLVIAVGFSSYGLILVRAMADPPMNENSPADAYSLRYYLAREQYGSAPLLYGPTFVANPSGTESAGTEINLMPKIGSKKAHYESKDKLKYTYDPQDMMLIPRMYDKSHASSYNSWIGRESNDSSPINQIDNMVYAFSYQINYMYWRYFLWNFSGRQNDLQGDGGLLRGNAITGIPFIDNSILGDQSSLPQGLKDNKGHNVYYLLPLLLGLIGLFYQALGKKEGLESFWITMLLFLMTGLAIVAYLNQYPDQPRERDYAYAGSFYAFAIWIGFGVVGIYKLLLKMKLKELPASVIASLILVLIPIQMASQNWDDHDRSRRTIARDMGINYLESCEPNAILFCYGDNDTFPLWYVQEVEGIRKDVRTANMSYLTGSWYVTQMHKEAYKAKPIPYKYMQPEFYYNHEVAYVYDKTDDILPLEDALKYLVNNISSDGVLMPSKYLSLNIDSAKQDSVISSLDESLKGRALDNMLISLKGKKYLTLSDLSIIDMIGANHWNRPIYWTITSPRSSFSNLANYELQVGMNYRLLPINLAQNDSTGKKSIIQDPMLVDRTYNLVMNKFRWCGADKPNTYFDENARNMMQGVRNNVIAPLATALLNRGNKQKAIEVLDKGLNNILNENIPYDFRSIEFVEALYKAGKIKEADEIALKVGRDQMALINWMMNLSPDMQQRALKGQDFTRSLYFGSQFANLSKTYGKDILQKERKELDELMNRLGYKS